jgi:hypothetical protein
VPALRQCPQVSKPVRYNPRPVTLTFRAPTGSGDAVDADRALMRRIGVLDASAIGELYDRHGALLFGLILPILGRRGDAEEVLQSWPARSPHCPRNNGC